MNISFKDYFNKTEHSKEVSPILPSDNLKSDLQKRSENPINKKRSKIVPQEKKKLDRYA